MSIVILKRQRWKNVLENQGGAPRRLFGVTADITSDILIKKKYTKHRVPDRVIRFALYCMDNKPELSLSGIRKEIEAKYGISLSRISIMRWQRKFRPNLTLYYRLSSEHTSEWNKKISQGVKRYHEIH